MANITPQMVKELRVKTGAGMGDCKKALVESDGVIEEAVQILRKKGAASAAKRADRATNEGTICAITTDDGKTSAIVEINSETDFVAINEQFVDYAKNVADTVLANNFNSLDELLAAKCGDDTIQGLHNEILAKFSEKIEISRFDKISTDGYVSAYIHAGNKLAVLIEVSKNGLSDNSKKLVHDVAMQIAAMNPAFVDRSEVSSELLGQEREIYLQQAIDAGKPADIAERIATGKLEKYYSENCLTEQSFVKDSKMTINDVMKNISDDFGNDVKVIKFTRYFLGEK